MKSSILNIQFAIAFSCCLEKLAFLLKSKVPVYFGNSSNTFEIRNHTLAEQQNQKVSAKLKATATSHILNWFWKESPAAAVRRCRSS